MHTIENMFYPEVVPVENERREIFFSTGEFLGLYQEEVKEVFGILGIEWPSDPKCLSSLVREKLIGRDHGEAEGKFLLDNSTAERILPVLQRIGMFDAFTPPPGHYDQLVIPGGTTAAFEGRLPWMRDEDIVVDEVVVLVGERRVDPNRDRAEDVFTLTDGDDAWARWRIKKGWQEANESDIARLMLSRTIGEMALRGVTWNAHPFNGGRKPQAFHFEVSIPMSGDDGARRQDLTVLHSGIAERANGGAARPTTENTFLHYLDISAPSRKNEPIKIIVASAGVYTMRMTEEVMRITRSQGRDDIVVVPAGFAPEPNEPRALARMGLDELGRMIDRSPSLKRGGL